MYNPDLVIDEKLLTQVYGDSIHEEKQMFKWFGITDIRLKVHDFLSYSTFGSRDVQSLDRFKQIMKWWQVAEIIKSDVAASFIVGGIRGGEEYEDRFTYYPESKQFRYGIDDEEIIYEVKVFEDVIQLNADFKDVWEIFKKHDQKVSSGYHKSILSIEISKENNRIINELTIDPTANNIKTIDVKKQHNDNKELCYEYRSNPYHEVNYYKDQYDKRVTLERHSKGRGGDSFCKLVVRDTNSIVISSDHNSPGQFSQIGKIELTEDYYLYMSRGFKKKINLVKEAAKSIEVYHDFSFYKANISFEKSNGFYSVLSSVEGGQDTVIFTSNHIEE